MRKFIQISASLAPESIKDHPCTYVTGLCDDGTIWQNTKVIVGDEEWGEWEQLPPVPQDEDA